MKTIQILLYSLFFLIAAPAAQAIEPVPGDLIVKYREGTRRELSAMRALYRSAGVTRVRRFGQLMRGFEQLALRDDVDPRDAIRALEASPWVEYAVQNSRIRAPFTGVSGSGSAAGGAGRPCVFPGFPPGCDPHAVNPLPEDPPPAIRPKISPAPPEPLKAVADPELSKAYGLSKTESNQAWALQPEARGVIVALVDSGVDYNHEDLALNLWRNPRVDRALNDQIGYDFFHGDEFPYDDVMSAVGRGHGTHVAGIIGAAGGNGVGISGVAPRVQLMILKVLNSEAGGTLADAIRAIDYAVARGARVINNSWALNADPSEEATTLLPIREAIQRAGKAGVLSVFAAGNGDDQGKGLDNDGKLRAYPASLAESSLISVAATDAQDKIADFSNFGKTTVHLAAPGVGVHSLVPSNLKYSSRDGTSMAAPFVSGAAALLWAKNPGWDFQRVKAAILSSVDPVTDAKVANQTVSGGRLNVRKALLVK